MSSQNHEADPHDQLLLHMLADDGNPHFPEQGDGSDVVEAVDASHVPSADRPRGTVATAKSIWVNSARRMFGSIFRVKKWQTIRSRPSKSASKKST